MFVCQKCLRCTQIFHLESFGRCEVCGKTRACVDCPPHHEWKEAALKRKPKKKVANG